VWTSDSGYQSFFFFLSGLKVEWKIVIGRNSVNWEQFFGWTTMLLELNVVQLHLKGLLWSAKINKNRK
jgi:hypothetical protein